MSLVKRLAAVAAILVVFSFVAVRSAGSQYDAPASVPVRAVSSQNSTPTSVPQGDPGQTYYAAFPVSITVNGDLNDWNNIPKVQLTDGPHPAANPSVDGSITFAAAADAQYLYFMFQVTDNHIVAGKHGENYFNEDSVELYLNATGNSKLASYQDGVAQITFPALNIGKSGNQAVYGGLSWQATGVQSATIKTSIGYNVEAAFPIQNSWWNITPSQGKELGFNVQLNDATQTDRDVKLNWASADRVQDQSHLNPSVFGKLIFYQMGSVQPTAQIASVSPTAQVANQAPTAQVASLPTATTPPPVQKTFAGNFSVKGSKIYDPSGRVFVAKGVNVNGQNWVWPRSTIQDADSIISCWQFNLVRVNSFLFTGQVSYPQFPNNNDLDQIVQKFTSRGVVVMFEAHDRIGSYYQGGDLSKLVQWYTDLATKYRNNPYVWFDVMNEPGERTYFDLQNWLNVNQQVIKAIRTTANANNVIVVEGAYGGQDTGTLGSVLVRTQDSAILSHADQVLTFDGKTYPNIVFSIHTYDLWNHGDAKLADYFDRVQAKNLAIIVGEYGVDAGVDTKPATQSMFDTAVPRGIGRIVWQWDGSDNNHLGQNASQGGWAINSCQNPTNLSWLGEQVWKDNHAQP